MKRLAYILLILVLLTGCAETQDGSRQTVFAMDTVMELQVWGADSEEALLQMEQKLLAMEKTWSATREDSLVAKLNSGGAILSQEQQELLQFSKDMSAQTGGAYHPMLGGYVALWGFYDKNYRIPDQDELEKVVAQWDLGGIVKGYAGGELVEILDTLDIDRAILNLGGNIQTYGEKEDGAPWQIAIQNPEGGVLGTVSVNGTMAIVTSGDYQRYFEQDGKRYHHIIDANSGYPADSDLASVTVICKDGAQADALSTGLFVMGRAKAIAYWMQYHDFDMVLLTKDGRIYATENVALADCQYEVISYEQ